MNFKTILCNRLKKVKNESSYTYDDLAKMYFEKYGDALTHKQIANMLKRDGENVSVDTIEKLLWVCNVAIGVVFTELPFCEYEEAIFNEILG